MISDGCSIITHIMFEGATCTFSFNLVAPDTIFSVKRLEYLNSNPVRAFMWERIGKELSILWEWSSNQCYGTIFWQLVRIKKYLSLSVQWVLNIHYT